MAVVRFDHLVKSRIIELYSLGYGLAEISKLIGIHRNTLTRWIKRHELQPVLDKAEQELMQGTIKRGLKALSEGAKSSETIKEYVKEDEKGNVCKVTEKIRTLAPNEKAIQILSQKYDKVFSQSEVKQLDAPSIYMSLNTSEMSLRELQKLPSPLGPVVDAECTEVEEKKEENSESLPPTRDGDVE